MNCLLIFFINIVVDALLVLCCLYIYVKKEKRENPTVCHKYNYYRHILWVIGELEERQGYVYWLEREWQDEPELIDLKKARQIKRKLEKELFGWDF